MPGRGNLPCADCEKLSAAPGIHVLTLGTEGEDGRTSPATAKERIGSSCQEHENAGCRSGQTLRSALQRASRLEVSQRLPPIFSTRNRTRRPSGDREARPLRRVRPDKSTDPCASIPPQSRIELASFMSCSVLHLPGLRGAFRDGVDDSSTSSPDFLANECFRQTLDQSGDCRFG